MTPSHYPTSKGQCRDLAPHVEISCKVISLLHSSYALASPLIDMAFLPAIADFPVASPCETTVSPP